MGDGDARKKEPLPLEALDDTPHFPAAPPPPFAATKPVEYLPPAAAPEPAAGPPSSLPGAAPLSPGGSTTKPTAYKPDEAHDPDARGYAVEGFSPSYRADDDPKVVVVVVERPRGEGYGDAKGEHLRMERGKASAWAYVVAAFVLQVAAIGALVALGVSRMPVDPALATIAPWAGGALVGVLFAAASFRDRWRCIEAYTSRFTRGPAAPLVTPFVAWTYANVRAARKLARR